ncbi:DUF1489 domain-containing protein [Acidiphilium sp. AL]|uniref:DUF1489 domain-containing protein n=1 Tax=Acidiphilium iwatense TaxID=768198 RepID=A0ABS9DUV5_9PROT|nr:MULTISPECIES: DUF1489 domain-containing protein [Acidiphilium]MCF3945252.1 DUF1489 domain-containing protein [Acidiphilium iwatense]MCU4159455.1 DUF1489 domain-containing protein [Acidiphilium sp. AL]
MIHLVKLAVGVKDVGHLAEIQRRRAQAEPPLRHRTRSMPKRADELRNGGSIYWVVGGLVIVRQRVLDVTLDAWDDGSPCAGLVLDPALVRVAARPMRPFQGWRYLAPEDAPMDITRDAATIEDKLPPELRRDLRALALLP